LRLRGIRAEQLIEQYGKLNALRVDNGSELTSSAFTEWREASENRLPEYNEERPHDSLGRVPPLMFMPRRKQPPESSYQLRP
jgi:transposase InsO family protein